jgi:hypothetical protein
MLFHVSTDAENPSHVAAVLAELMGGKATPFPPVAEGSWVAHGGDDRNTLVEVYPRGTELFPSAEGGIGLPGNRAAHASIHFALATGLGEAEVHAIGRREGWPVATHWRADTFRVIELWLEGTRLVEILTPEMQQEYLDGVRLERWEAMLGEMALAA